LESISATASLRPQSKRRATDLNCSREITAIQKMQDTKTGLTVVILNNIDSDPNAVAFKLREWRTQR
jgi:hypothetical protein